MILCVKFHEMYTMEHAVKNCEDINNYETLHKVYILSKENFDEQYKKVENLITLKQK